ncbi:hypothetical protein Thiowin_02242 [Thiorhodovibrio winogradskyi]|uniref:DUF2939 domain-containing protein n=1 Tax=Thiorhodovibrio winogradskyi TaxID=77007 RepID=A0ABZ0SB21_9GAMM|nr:DUF2939 domain-containing protein [Thiorhodovibrio winogradskyi]
MRVESRLIATLGLRDIFVEGISLGARLMLKIARNLVILAVLLYALWPYVAVFRLNSALAELDARASTQALAPLVDLPAIQARYKSRLGNTVDAWLPRGGDSDEMIGWLSTNLQQLGDSALDQAITLDWVRDSLREAMLRTAPEKPDSLLAAVDFAFFESWNRFVVRIGELGANPTHLVLRLQGYRWQLTDIAR